MARIVIAVLGTLALAPQICTSAIAQGYLNQSCGLCGTVDALGAQARQRVDQRRPQGDLAQGLGSEGPPTREQVQALIINPATEKLGLELYRQRLGTPDFPWPTNVQLQALIANSATQQLGVMIYRRKMGLPPG